MFFCSFFYGIWIAFGEFSNALPAAQPNSLTRRVCTMANLNQDEIPSDSHHPSLLATCLNSSISSLEPDVVLQQENITCRHALVVNLFHWISTFKAHADRGAAGACEVFLHFYFARVDCQAVRIMISKAQPKVQMDSNVLHMLNC